MKHHFVSLFLIFFSVTLHAKSWEEKISYRFTDTATGKVDKDIYLKKTKGDRVIISKIVPVGDESTWEIHEEGHFLNWDYVNVKDEKTFTATRIGEDLKVGKKSYSFGKHPWFQNLGFGISRWAHTSSPAEVKTKFWLLNPNTMNTTLFSAEKIKDEIIKMKNGEEELCQKVLVRLSGWRSIMWSSEYWIRKSDGLFLRHLGDEGPGTPEHLTEFESIEKFK